MEKALSNKVFHTCCQDCFFVVKTASLIPDVSYGLFLWDSVSISKQVKFYFYFNFFYSFLLILISFIAKAPQPISLAIYNFMARHCSLVIELQFSSVSWGIQWSLIWAWKKRKGKQMNCNTCCKISLSGKEHSCPLLCLPAGSPQVSVLLNNCLQSSFWFSSLSQIDSQISLLWPITFSPAPSWELNVALPHKERKGGFNLEWEMELEDLWFYEWISHVTAESITLWWCKVVLLESSKYSVWFICHVHILSTRFMILKANHICQFFSVQLFCAPWRNLTWGTKSSSQLETYRLK